VQRTLDFIALNKLLHFLLFLIKLANYFFVFNHNLQEESHGKLVKNIGCCCAQVGLTCTSQWNPKINEVAFDTASIYHLMLLQNAQFVRLCAQISSSKLGTTLNLLLNQIHTNSLNALFLL
jgi:hypothetical protein